MLMRFLGLASIAGIIGVAGVAGAITIRGDDNAKQTETSGGNVALRQEGQARNRATKQPRPLAPTPAKSAAVVVEAPPPAETVKAPTPTPAAVPVVAPPVAAAPVRASGTGSLLSEGRTTLADSIYAFRSGDSVTVNFDTHGNRTGRADKFETMVRTTLPLVYGRRNTVSLDSVPVGSLLPSRDVLGALVTRGMHLTLDNGVKIALWPQTRPTSDGPLVVAYLLLVER
jgi:hypothetical protein